MAELGGDEALPHHTEANIWPVLPGESLNQLAALFYPGNKSMQKAFVARTQELSRELDPDLDPAKAFAEPGVLIIPELKALSRQARPFKSHRRQARNSSSLQMSYQLREAGPIVTPQMHAEYEGLNQRNLALEQSLQSLRLRQENLQTSLSRMQAAAANSLPAAPANLPVDRDASIKPVSLPLPVPRQSKADASMGAELNGNSLLIQFLLLLAALLFFIALWYWIRKLKALQFKKITNDQLDGMRKNVFNPMNNSLMALTETGSMGNSDEILSVEEITSVVEEARIFMSMERPNEAIQLLRDYIENSPHGSLQPWLYLLEIYRKLGKKDEFSELAKRFHRTFNAMTPQWGDHKIAMVVANSLEEFPHIVSQLQEVWAKPEALEYLDQLLGDNRDGERVGFSLNVVLEIVMLMEILDIREQLPT